MLDKFQSECIWRHQWRENLYLHNNKRGWRKKYTRTRSRWKNLAGRKEEYKRPSGDQTGSTEVLSNYKVVPRLASGLLWTSVPPGLLFSWFRDSLLALVLISQSQRAPSSKPDGGAQLCTQMCLAETTQEMLLRFFAALRECDTLGSRGVAPPGTRGLWVF